MFFLIVNKPCNCGGTWSKLKKNPNLHNRLLCQKNEDVKEKNNSSDEIVSRIEKIKMLYEEEILTEEEYQQKKDELVSKI